MILDISRITSGKLRLSIYPVDLVFVIEAAIDTVRLAAEARLFKLSRYRPYSRTYWVMQIRR